MCFSVISHLSDCREVLEAASSSPGTLPALQGYLDGFGRLISVAALHALQQLLASVGEGGGLVTNEMTASLITPHNISDVWSDQNVYVSCGPKIMPQLRLFMLDPSHA